MARVALGLATGALALVLAAAAIVPGRAWSPGSAGLADVSALDRGRVLVSATGLMVAPIADGALVATGDGGGVGAIEGFGAGPIRIRAAMFRGVRCWEIGTEPGRPASYVDDNGIRLDDGMLDRLHARAWPWPSVLALAALVAVAYTRRRVPDRTRLVAPGLLVLAALLVASQLA